MITIDKTSTIHRVKDDFAALFPNLKIEFFTMPHAVGAPSPSSEMLHEDYLLSSAYPGMREGVFMFNDKTTVADFEQGMQKDFGIPIQVFRWSNGIWLETTTTDKFTLATQNTSSGHNTKKASFNFNTLFL